MKEYKKIDFDYKLITDPKVIIEYANGQRPEYVYISLTRSINNNLKHYPLVSVNVKRETFLHCANGEYDLNKPSDLDLIMYKEVENEL